MKIPNNKKPNAQIYSHWGIRKGLEGEARICYFDSYDNLMGLVCVMPKDAEWPGSTKNAKLIIELFNKYKARL